MIKLTAGSQAKTKCPTEYARAIEMNLSKSNNGCRSRRRSFHPSQVLHLGHSTIFPGPALSSGDPLCGCGVLAKLGEPPLLPDLRDLASTQTSEASTTITGIVMLGLAAHSNSPPHIATAAAKISSVLSRYCGIFVPRSRRNANAKPSPIQAVSAPSNNRFPYCSYSAHSGFARLLAIPKYIAAESVIANAM
jgi:hypothetical protein